jgi:hypothetical protein
MAAAAVAIREIFIEGRVWIKDTMPEALRNTLGPFEKS